MTLTAYGHRGLGPRRFRSPAFDDRADMALVTLVRRCARLTRLVVRDRVSTATLIVLAAEGTQLLCTGEGEPGKPPPHNQIRDAKF